MAEMSRLFNFDDFDRRCAEALEEYDTPAPVIPLRRPGELGAVIVYVSEDEEPDPPEAA